MVDGIDVCYSIASTFLVQLFYAIRKSLMALICAPKSGSILDPLISWKRAVSTVTADTSANAMVKRTKDNRPNYKLVHPTILGAGAGAGAGDHQQSTNAKSIHEDIKQHDHLEEVDHADAPFDINSSNKKSPGLLKVNKRRPTKLLIPGNYSAGEFGFAGDHRLMDDSSSGKVSEVEGDAFCLFARKGGRHAMEDRYGTLNATIRGSQLDFFGVYDGHGGRAAVDYISDNLGKNIISQISQLDKGQNQLLEMAIRAGYLTTDQEFINQEVRSGACAATAIVLDGELYVANAGDCRIVISQNGVAHALTTDHSASREDERARIENSGGFVSCSYGSVYRVQDSLAVSRAFGNILLKKWVISEPDITKMHLTPHSAFLLLASDGLWNKVSNQEAVDYVLQHGISSKSCKDLAELSRGRGTRDDITVMLVDLPKLNLKQHDI